MQKKKRKPSSSDHTGDVMSLTGNLKELRNRLAVVIVLLVAAFLVCLTNAQSLVELFTQMGTGYGYHFVYISPQELLMEYFSISLVIALVVCLPVIAWEVWRFVQPGLRRRENQAFAMALIFGMIFFCLGVAFAYKVSMPFILYFLIHVGDGSQITAAVSVQNYISFLLTVFLVFGCVFELPVISVVLTWLGVIRSSWLKKARKPAIVLIFLVSAIITPPDVVSQIMVALPMILLFQLGIFLSSLCEKSKKKSAAEEDAEEEAV